ncbi:MAG: thioredoxin domain-containing protein [Saprospiraceae bacterium]|nr:thioredoxin domain-containing protein [Candidatus Vicinibacter affinis]
MNELLKAQSPYLLQHKDNPVHWKVWSPETLKLAIETNKPILVSVGYSTCHWCHVMAHESFEDADIAAIMNEFFICIKVDREERPDIDQYMMNAVQLLGVSGGWPLHVFLTPDLKPFYGGTYFPPIRKYGRISWPELLIAIHKAFIQKPKELELQGQKLVEALSPKLTTEKADFTEASNSEKLLGDVAKIFGEVMDKEFGGFGFGQKFPNTQALEFLLKNQGLFDEWTAIKHIHLSLRKMCLGGMFDHLAGGFCRYTTDRAWKIPHFEKMGYDHALILQLLAKVHQNYREHGYLFFIKKSLDFWEQEMKSSSGLFYAAMDADSDGEEGKFYVWTESEIQSCLGEDYNFVRPLLELIPMHEADKHVLCLNEATLVIGEKINLEKLLKIQAGLSTMNSLRNTRVRPSVDTKLILGWNALIVKTYCNLYICLVDKEVKLKALSLVDRIWERYKIGERELKFYRYLAGDQGVGLAFLEDLAYLLDALLSAHQISLNVVYLERIEEVLKLLNEEFIHPSGFYNIHSKNHLDSLGQGIELLDHSTPNPNAIIASVLWAMYQITELEEYQQRAKSMLHKALIQVEGSYFSSMSWIDLYQQINGNQILVKCKNVDSVYLYLKDQTATGYLVCEDKLLAEDELQFCSQQMCFPIAKGPKEIKDSWNQLITDIRK